jgi:capsid protein
MARPGILARLASLVGLKRGVAYNYDTSRFPQPARGRLMHGAPADLKTEQTPYDQREILRAARYLDKNNGFVSAWVNANLTYGIGDGLRYQPLTTSPDWNAAAKEVVARAMQRPEVTGRFNGLQFQRMIGKAAGLIDGELFLIKMTRADGSPCVQAIESHRVCQPSGYTAQQGWVNGIKFNEQGTPTTIAIQEDDGGFAFRGYGTVIHIYQPDRFTGVRGISPLSVVVNGCRDRAEVLASEKLAVKEFSRRTFVLTSQDGEFGAGDSGILGRAVSRPGGPNAGRTAQDVADAFGGLAMAVGQGEKLEAFEHNRPSLNVLGFLDMLDRDAANALGISSDFLLNPTKIGGAVVRMELAKAERQFSSFQNVVIEGLRPFIQFVLATAIERGELAAQPGWERMTFQTPRRLSVDVGRDTLAMIRGLEAGATNLRDILEEGGKEYEAEVIARLDDKVWAIKQATARGLTYDDVSLTSILSKPAEEPKTEAGTEDEPPSQEEPEEMEDAETTTQPPTPNLND